MKSAIGVVVLAGILGLLRPWTVVPIQTTVTRAFDTDAYVASIWESRVMPTAERSAIELQAFLDGQTTPDVNVQGPQGNSGARAVFVKGTARIAVVDRRSRVGLARLALPGASDGHTAAIQIGPVIRGTALRDALGFIRFTDFVNQLEFAGVASGLNDRVVKDVLEPTPDIVPGVDITFIGAVPVSSSAQIAEIVPVKLILGEGVR